MYGVDAERYLPVRDQIKDMSLGEFTVGDLEALMGLLHLIDGFTSLFHPSEEDLKTIQDRLEAIAKLAEAKRMTSE